MRQTKRTCAVEILGVPSTQIPCLQFNINILAQTHAIRGGRGCFEEMGLIFEGVGRFPEKVRVAFYASYKGCQRIMLDFTDIFELTWQMQHSILQIGKSTNHP
mgnify:CR=1 FL=1